MDAPLADAAVEEITAEEAFAILGNETRMAVLRTLWEAEDPVAFTDLRRRVAPDDRGNFSYHLDRLVDHFVRRTDEGYRLRFAGEQVVRAVLTGTITADFSVPPGETDDRCVYCGAPVEMAYEGEVISARCTACGGVVGGELPPGTFMRFEFPPSGLAGRTRERVVDAAHVLYDAKLAPMIKGICPECAGRVAISHEVCDDHDPDASGLCPACDTRYRSWSRFECQHCRYARRSVTWFAALNHPAVVAFLHEHGLDEPIPFRKLTWDNERFVRDIATTVLEADPPRFRVTIPVDGETLAVELDESLGVRSVAREDGGD